MNNLTAIKAMASWMNMNGKTPAPENYIDLYLNKIFEQDLVDEDSMYDDADYVLDYSEEDILEEISAMEHENNYYHSEDCENIEDWNLKSSLE